MHRILSLRARENRSTVDVNLSSLRRMFKKKEGLEHSPDLRHWKIY